MKTLRYILPFFAALALFSCREKEPEFLTTDQGPSQSVTYDASALMGSAVNFSVALDDEIALSTLKVKLLFDETVVADTTIRTKENGTYDGFLKVPFLKNIPDGVATLRVTSQNIRFGVTEQDYDVSVSRPDFPYLTLVGEGGDSYRMERVSRNNYAVSGSFPAEMNAMIETPAIDAAGRKFTFGFNASTGITVGASGLIPFSSVENPYEISFNTFSFEGAPFVTIEINGVKAGMIDKNNYAAVLNISKGTQMEFSGIDAGEYTLDPDFFNEDGTFAAADGLYKITVQLASKYFLVERMATESDYATLDTHAVWMIGGSCYGKPLMFSASWNTSYGLCLAEVENNVYQITFIAGFQLSRTDVNVKFFHQKGWGGEFGGDSLTTDSDLIIVGTGSTASGGNGTDSGNIVLAEGVTLDMAGIYRFTLDLNGSPVVHFSKIGDYSYEAPKFAVNGVEFEGGPTVFEATLPLTKGEEIKITELDGLSSYWWDPDFFDGGSFAAVSARYKISVNTDAKVISARRVNEDGTAPNLENGGLYFQGWGVAAYKMTAQVGWPGTGGYQMAQVSDGVFQMTGKAVAETDDTIGGRFRYDYISAKWFFQDGWGGEASKGVEISGNAAGLVTQGGDGNLGLASNLEEGATYRLTVDFSGCIFSGASLASGTEKVTFEKL